MNGSFCDKERVFTDFFTPPPPPCSDVVRDEDKLQDADEDEEHAGQHPHVKKGDIGHSRKAGSFLMILLSSSRSGSMFLILLLQT